MSHHYQTNWDGGGGEGVVTVSSHDSKAKETPQYMELLHVPYGTEI